MASKWEVMDALKRSTMKAPAKAVVMMLLSAANADTAAIPDQFTPSLTDLAEWTSLGRSTVAEYLKALEASGWVIRERPAVADAINKGRRTCYRLAVGSEDLPPELALVRRKRGSRKDAVSASDGPGAGLSKGKETGQDSPGAGLVQEMDSPGAGPSIVQELDSDSPGAGHNKELPTGVLNSSVHHSSSSRQVAPVSEALFAAEEPKPAKAPKRHRRPYGNPDFDAFWEIYPRKDDPKKAWSCWQSAVKAVDADDRAALVADIIAGAERYRDDPNRSDQYTKLATTWLNAGAWENGSLPPRGDRGSPQTHQPYQDPDPASYHGKI